MILAELPEGWEWRNLGGIGGMKPACEFLDRLRVPVNEKERAKRPGPYPYYGANGQQGCIDDFIFDEELVLLAEDEGFFFSTTRPASYRVTGKCWVNNHAHVLRPAKDVHPDWLNECLAFADFTPFIPEPVRPKLNQKNAKKIPIPVPPYAEQLKIVVRIDDLQSHFDAIKSIQQEIEEQLSKFRPALLAKALRGEL